MSFKFGESLVKGKIAEVIFEEMFHSQGEFEVLHHGFEYTSPEIAQNLQNLNREALERIRHQPDFILVSWDKKEQLLVEVKYRKVKEENRILKIVMDLRNNYGPTYLFLATPEAFYFDSCMSIIEKGYIDKLFESWIPRDVQEKYLKLLNEFISK